MDQEIVITRELAAPRDRVFKTWTDAERMKGWWGPNGFTTPVCRIDARPGGIFRSCMRSPDGKDYWSKGVYREVVVPERIVCTDFFSDEAGNMVPPTQYGMSPEWPKEALLTVTFVEHDGKTKLTLRHAVGSAPATEREMCHAGWNESLDRLAAYLAKA